MRTTDKAALAFTLLYTSLAVPRAVATGNGEFAIYIAVMAVLIALVARVHLTVRLHAATLWGLSVWGLLHMAGGLIVVSEETGVLYNLWFVEGRLKYDQVVHAYGFGMSTWVAWQALRRRLADPSPTLGMLFLSVCAGTGLGAMNEVVEFAATLLVPETNVGGYVNTGWDLVANLVGATTAAVWIRLAAHPAAPG